MPNSKNFKARNKRSNKKACKRKKPYESEIEAKDAVFQLRRKFKWTRSYHCPVCKNWHLASRYPVT